MNDQEIEKLLLDEFANRRTPPPDQAFAASVMRQIGDSDLITLDARRPFIIGLAFIMGMVVMLISLTSLDLSFITTLQDFLASLFESTRTAPAWHTIVIILPFLWLALVDG